VPVERRSDGSFSATLLGETRACRSERELEQLLEAIRFNGMYPWLASEDEIGRHAADAAARDALFERIMLEELRRWVALADERMAAQGIDVFVIAGNDDPWSVDDVLKQASHVQFCDDKIVQVGPHEMLSSSYANRTPWNSPRELDEDELYTRLKRLAEQLERPQQAIFNLHVPPYDSGLDRAIEIDPDDLTHVYHSGVPHEVPVGSTAVRQIIEEYQPVLALHGHIHESRGEVNIGRTLAINSGSDYNSGRIHGIVIRLADATVISHQFVNG
jgi:Icc-related predicted phosphoesterase